MSLALLAALGAAAIALPQTGSDNASTNSPATDHMVAALFADQDVLGAIKGIKTEHDADEMLKGEGNRAVFRGLYSKVRSERRDTEWGPATERGLKAVFSTIPHIGVTGTELRTICGSTLCEVAGTIDTSFGTKEQATWDELNKTTMPKLNPTALELGAGKLKLEIPWGTMGSTAEKPPRPVFVFYLSRERAGTK